MSLSDQSALIMEPSTDPRPVTNQTPRSNSNGSTTNPDSTTAGLGILRQVLEVVDGDVDKAEHLIQLLSRLSSNFPQLAGASTSTSTGTNNNNSAASAAASAGAVAVSQLEC